MACGCLECNCNIVSDCSEIPCNCCYWLHVKHFDELRNTTGE